MYTATYGNAVSLLLRQAVEKPEHVAIVCPLEWKDGKVVRSFQTTFGLLTQRAGELAQGLEKWRFRPRERVILSFPVSVELYAMMIALLSRGQSVVYLDPEMGPEKVSRAIKNARARAIIGTDTLLRKRFLRTSLWGLRKFSVDSSGLFLQPFSSLWGCYRGWPEVLPMKTEDRALVTFSPGNTGDPKGVERSHAVLIAQHQALREELGHRGDDVEMTFFPMSVFHILCSGITAVLPALTFPRSSSPDGGLLVSQLLENQVTRLSASPVYLEPIVLQLERFPQRLPALRQVIAAGAPMPRQLCERLLRVFPGVDCRVLYRSSEAEPICHVRMEEIVSARGEGVLVGTPGRATALAVVNLPDPLPTFDSNGFWPYLTKPGESGEIFVSGPHVTRSYFCNPSADRHSKLRLPDNSNWHRTGDVGRLDDRGRLWLTGLSNGVRRRPEKPNAGDKP